LQDTVEKFPALSRQACQRALRQPTQRRSAGCLAAPRGSNSSLSMPHCRVGGPETKMTNRCSLIETAQHTRCGSVRPARSARDTQQTANKDEQGRSVRHRFVCAAEHIKRPDALGNAVDLRGDNDRFLPPEALKRRQSNHAARISRAWARNHTHHCLFAPTGELLRGHWLGGKPSHEPQTKRHSKQREHTGTHASTLRFFSTAYWIRML
jgi:hypothetical protein